MIARRALIPVFGLRASCLVAMMVLAGCAGHLVLQPVALQPLPRPAPSRTLAAGATGEPATGSSRPLPAGMRLQAVGSVPEGMVLRPIGREIMVVGQDRDEAYLVVKDSIWVGYYLPVERAYLGLKQPVPLILE